MPESGKSFDLESNDYFVNYSFNGDISKFWDEVDKKAPHKKDALS
jgi:hypothetical protein